MTQPERIAAIHAAAVPEPWSVEAFAVLLRDPLFFCLEAEGAFLLARSVAGEAELIMVATDPDHRRQGRAKDLMTRFHDMAAQRGAAKTFLEVAEDNGPARALYAAAAYAQVGRRKGYYRRPGTAAVDALVLSRSLAPPRG